MATLKEIADRAGVNTSTVSKALRGSNDIKPETCSRIRAIADEMGYVYRQPKTPTAASTIGLIFPELGSQYYNEIQVAFRRRMERLGFRTLVQLTDFDRSRELAALEAMLDGGQVGGICMLTENADHFRQMRAMVERNGIPFLLICAHEDIDFCDTISINHTIGAALAVEHLIELGHKKIAYIGEANTIPRETSFRSTMREHGLALPAEYVLRRTDRFELCGYLGMKQLLASGDPPTAVFAAYDNIAIGAMRAIYEAGLRIPEDISVIGIDANMTAQFVWPSLTSVTSPTADIGELASVLLGKRMEGRHTASYQSIRLCPTLKHGESTAPPRTVKLSGTK